MATLQEVEAELVEVYQQLTPLIHKRSRLQAELARLKSLAWIEANEVQREDVELSKGDGKPWFGYTDEFGKWLEQNSTKRFCEWNGILCHTAEMVADISIWPPGRLDDLPA